MGEPGDVFQDVAPAETGEELERDETYVPGDPDNVVDLSNGGGDPADRLGGDGAALPADEPPQDILDEERPVGDPTPVAEEPAPAQPEPTPEPVAEEPAAAEPEPTPEPSAAEPTPAAPAPTPTPKPTPAPTAEKGKGNESRAYLVFLFTQEAPHILHQQVHPVPEVAEGEEAPEPEPVLIEASNWDRAMKIAYRQFAPEGGEIGIAVCPQRNMRQHVVSEKPRPREVTGIHFG